MTGKAVLENSDPKYFDPRKVDNGTVISSYTPLEVATTLTFTTAIFQVILVY